MKKSKHMKSTKPLDCENIVNIISKLLYVQYSDVTKKTHRNSIPETREQD